MDQPQDFLIILCRLLLWAIFLSWFWSFAGKQGSAPNAAKAMLTDACRRGSLPRELSVPAVESPCFKHVVLFLCNSCTHIYAESHSDESGAVMKFQCSSHVHISRSRSAFFSFSKKSFLDSTVIVAVCACFFSSSFP